MWAFPKREERVFARARDSARASSRAVFAAGMMTMTLEQKLSEPVRERKGCDLLRRMVE